MNQRGGRRGASRAGPGGAGTAGCGRRTQNGKPWPVLHFVAYVTNMSILECSHWQHSRAVETQPPRSARPTRRSGTCCGQPLVGREPIPPKPHSRRLEGPSSACCPDPVTVRALPCRCDDRAQMPRSARLDGPGAGGVPASDEQDGGERHQDDQEGELQRPVLAGRVVARLSHYAAAEAQALCTAVICSGVGCAGHSGRNRAAMMVRRSLASMSAKDGSVLVVYQGAAARWVVTSSGWWPERVYQQ